MADNLIERLLEHAALDDIDHDICDDCGKAARELSALRTSAQLLVLRMESLGLDMDPRLRNFWQRTYEAANL